MRLSLLGISISLFGIALLIKEGNSATSIGLGVSLLGLLVSFVSCFISAGRKNKE